jgi:hypothetical protein
VTFLHFVSFHTMNIHSFVVMHKDNSQYITDKEFVGKFKVWRESTSTSPSG